MMKKSKALSIWLFIGCAMVLCQISIGGITRLTDSGLSITEWNVIKGTIPPLNEDQWSASFEKYKVYAKKQYESLHKDMTLEQFKRIYFWEYFHRLWARLMSFVFIIPFFIFLLRRKIDSSLLKRLLIIILLAGIVAVFGWIMVKSGLSDDKRTWVSAYKLLAHIFLTTILFSYLLYTYYKYSFREYESRVELKDYGLLKTIGVFIFIQIAFGALMAGMKAALTFPYPFMLLKLNTLKSILFDNPTVGWMDWINYEPNPLIKIIIQILHRGSAIGIFILSIWFFIVNRVKMFIATSYLTFYFILIIQIVLGIITIMFSVGKVPVALGVAHQITAFLLLASYLWIIFSSRMRK